MKIIKKLKIFPIINYWIEYLDELSCVREFPQTDLIKEKLKFSNEVKDIYIHLKLVNFYMLLRFKNYENCYKFNY